MWNGVHFWGQVTSCKSCFPHWFQCGTPESHARNGAVLHCVECAIYSASLPTPLPPRPRCQKHFPVTVTTKKSSQVSEDTLKGWFHPSEDHAGLLPRRVSTSLTKLGSCKLRKDLRGAPTASASELSQSSFSCSSPSLLTCSWVPLGISGFH